VATEDKLKAVEKHLSGFYSGVVDIGTYRN
jgi:hypothetical protein